MRQVIEHTPSSNSRKLLVIPHYFGAGENRTSKEGRISVLLYITGRAGYSQCRLVSGKDWEWYKKIDI